MQFASALCESRPVLGKLHNSILEICGHLETAPVAVSGQQMNLTVMGYGGIHKLTGLRRLLQPTA